MADAAQTELAFTIAGRLRAPLMRPGRPIFVKMCEWADEGLRWKLARWWGAEGEPDTAKWLPWLMLNPSTASGSVDDPTLLRIIHFTWLWGFDGLWVFNVYPYRTPSPRDLARIVVGWDKRSDWSVRDTIWNNHNRITAAMSGADAMMAAWGDPSGALGVETDCWVESLREEISEDRPEEIALFCVGETKNGEPKHPLARGKHRVANDARPLPFGEPAP